MPTKTLAIANNKGGTAKTTTCASLAGALKERCQRALLVDLDPQASLTDHFGADPETLTKDQTIYGALFKEDVGLSDVILCVREGIDLVPANKDLAAAESLMVSEPGGEAVLSTALKKLPAPYDYILIDCPPGLGACPSKERLG